MKKYLLCLLMVSIMCFSASCGNSVVEEENTDVQQEEVVENVPEESANSHTQDGITITVSGATVEAYEDSEGKYDQKVSMQYEIKNDTDAAFGYTNAAWNAKLADGFKLETFVDMADMDLNQVPSQTKKEATVTFLVENGVAAEQFTAEYSFFDYNEEYWADLGKIMSGEMGQEEYMEKYGDIENNIMAFDVTVK